MRKVLWITTERSKAAYRWLHLFINIVFCQKLFKFTLSSFYEFYHFVFIEDTMAHAMGLTTNTCPFNMTGHPSLSINAGFSEELPVGMMITGKRFHEATVLKVAYAFQQQRDAEK